MSLLQRSATELARMIREREVSSVEVVRAHVERIEAVPGISRAGAVLYTPAMLTRQDLRSPEFAEIQEGRAWAPPIAHPPHPRKRI